jgi:hypothetical protein
VAHLALCVFDYGKDYVQALKYRNSELPFVVRNDPRVAEAVERWNDESYRTALFSKGIYHRAEQSDSTEFLFWRPDVHAKGPAAFDKMPADWKEPTQLIQMAFDDWQREAREKEQQLLLLQQQQNPSSSSTSTNKILYYNATKGPFYYYRLIGCGETGPTGDCDKISTSEYLFDELTFFQPRPGELYLTQPYEQRGIHCRFGMPGVIAENHFDSSRNAIVVLGGQRRYILSKPQQCPNLALYPLGHPSARHSQVNWTQVGISSSHHDNNDHDWKDQFPQFANARSNEVVLQAGDVLHLPTNWFHYIVSLSVNYQCNTRSGRTTTYDEPIEQCGFTNAKTAS